MIMGGGQMELEIIEDIILCYIFHCLEEKQLVTKSNALSWNTENCICAMAYGTLFPPLINDRITDLELCC